MLIFLEEIKMSNITIQETFKLPSNGLVYNRKIDPIIHLDSMTTAHEMKRLQPSDSPYWTLCSIIDECGAQDCGMSSYDMCLGDYQYLLYMLRVVTHGSQYQVVNNCPYCRSETKETIPLDELDVLEYTPELEKYKEFELPKSGNTISLKVQTPRMLDNISERAKDVRKKSKSGKVDNTLLYTLTELIDKVDGREMDDVELEKWVTQLPMADTNTILQYSDKFNTSIGIDTEILCTCPICGLSYTSRLKTTNEFFRPSLDI